MKARTFLAAALLYANNAAAQHEGHHAQHATDTPRAPVPALTDADRQAARPPAHDHPVHDNTVHSFVLFNRLEAFDAEHGTGLEWEGQAWIGTDTDKLWLRSEGERIDGRTQAADLEVMYGRPISPSSLPVSRPRARPPRRHCPRTRRRWTG